MYIIYMYIYMHIYIIFGKRQQIIDGISKIKIFYRIQQIIHPNLGQKIGLK